MKIRTQLIISIVLFIIALLIVAASIVITNQQVDRLNQQQELVKSIELGAGELGYLSNDYLLYHESQQLDRWNSKYAALSDDLARLSVDTPEQQDLVNTIKASQQRLKDVFDDAVSTIKSTNQPQYDVIDPAYIQVTWSRLAVQTRGITFDASRLSQILHDQENQVKQTDNLFIMALLGAFGTFVLIDYLLLFGGVIKSIGNLRAGTRIIGSGNLDHKIKARKGSEIGDLADEFNQMTSHLKAVTSSKEELENEIGERKRTEEELAYVASFPELNPSPIIEIDNRGNILYSNPAAKQLFPDLTTMASTGTCHPMFEGLEPAMSIFEGGRRQVVRDIKINGVFYQQAIYYLPDKNTVRIYFTDITERKRAEEEVKESKMQSELYLDLMGHDISNMHQIALGQLELAQEMIDADGRLEGENRELIDTSVKTLRRSAKLIQNIRNIQKLRSGEHKFEKIDLGNVLDEAVQVYSNMTDRDIVIDYSPVHGYYLIANPLLKDIFANLLDNAVKHCDDPVRISVNVSRVEQYGSSHYQVVVEDNGRGVPDDKKAEIFNRLKRGDTKARGTGLGLYIVRTLVEGFDGTVSLEDRVPGDHTKGAKFIVRLPIEGSEVHRPITHRRGA